MTTTITIKDRDGAVIKYFPLADCPANYLLPPYPPGVKHLQQMTGAELNAMECKPRGYDGLTIDPDKTYELVAGDWFVSFTDELTIRETMSEQEYSEEKIGYLLSNFTGHDRGGIEINTDGAIETKRRDYCVIMQNHQSRHPDDEGIVRCISGTNSNAILQSVKSARVYPNPGSYGSPANPFGSGIINHLQFVDPDTPSRYIECFFAPADYRNVKKGSVFVCPKWIAMALKDHLDEVARRLGEPKWRARLLREDVII